MLSCTPKIKTQSLASFGNADDDICTISCYLLSKSFPPSKARAIIMHNLHLVSEFYRTDDYSASPPPCALSFTHFYTLDFLPKGEAFCCLYLSQLRLYLDDRATLANEARTEVQPSVIDLLLLLVLQAAFKFQITFSARANGIERETFRLGYRLVLHFN